MGTNKRYASYYDKLMEKRVTELLIRPNPLTLSDAEIDAEHDPITQAKRPIRVRAWARYPETPPGSRAARSPGPAGRCRSSGKTAGE
jgi:hypothetical protein